MTKMYKEALRYLVIRISLREDSAILIRLFITPAAEKTAALLKTVDHASAILYDIFPDVAA
jgi:hypothetical protein